MSERVEVFQWEDLLSVPFLLGGDDPAVGLDCYGQWRVVAARRGLTIPRLPTDRISIESAEVLSGMTFVGPRATDARRIGDGIVSDPKRLGFPSHVAILIDERTRYALSVDARSGRAYAWPAWRHPCDYGVWRP